MPWYKNYESAEHRHARQNPLEATNYDASSNSAVKGSSPEQTSFFQSHIKQYTEFISWARWYPDLFLDLIRPKTGGIKLHFDQRVFLRAISRFVSVYGVFPRGWGKCVADDTYIYTDRGMIRIEELFGNKKDGIDDYTGKLDLKTLNKDRDLVPIYRGTYNGFKETKKISTRNGYYLECSRNHPILTETKNGNHRFIMADHLRVGDKVVIASGEGVWVDKETPFLETLKGTKYAEKLMAYNAYCLKNKRHNKIKTKLKGDGGLAYVIGCLVGCGIIDRGNGVSFYTKRTTPINNCARIIKQEFDDVLFHPEEGLYKTRTSDLGRFLKALGIKDILSNEGNLEVPEIILKGTKIQNIMFLRGYLDSVGMIKPGKGSLRPEVQLRIRNDKLRRQIQLMFLNFGIFTYTCLNKRRRTPKREKLSIISQPMVCKLVNNFYKLNNWAEVPEELEGLYAVADRYQFTNTKGFIERRKNEKEYIVTEIESIEDGKNHVYDISVPQTHSFISNGFVSHNTWGEVISMFVTAILYPGITMSLTAQTKANAAELLKDKYLEITKQYPLIKNEIVKVRFAKDDTEINFINGSRIDVLANAQQSKGQRRNRMEIEEAALIDNTTFEDALKPIVEVGRITQGKLGVVDPLELNQSISFYTTAGFRGSDEHLRNIQMYKDMIDCKGDFVLGSGWMLGCWMGRGSNKLQILKKKETTGSVSFARNYEEKWVGAADNALVDINKLLKTRTLTEPLYDDINNDREIVLGVDVARSASNANNKTVISVVEEHHLKNGLILSMDLVNMFLVSNQLNFTAQACLVKKVQRQYNAKIVVVDTNGLGSGLRDELLKPNVDVSDGESYPAWDTVNGDIKSEYRDAKPLLFALNSQSKDETKKDGRINSYAIINFIDCVEGQKIKLLEERKDAGTNINDLDEVKEFVPFAQTNALVEEIANLKLIHLSNGEVTVQKVLYKIDKDRFSSLMYAMWWIMSYDNFLQEDKKDLILAIAKMNRYGGSSGRRNSLDSIFR